MPAAFSTARAAGRGRITRSGKAPVNQVTSVTSPITVIGTCSTAEKEALASTLARIPQFAGTSLWFAVNAVMGDLQRELGWPAQAVGTLTSAVQLGFIAGTLVFALLATSSLPVLQAIGVTVTLGVIGNFILALLLTRPRAQPHAAP